MLKSVIAIGALVVAGGAGYVLSGNASFSDVVNTPAVGVSKEAGGTQAGPEVSWVVAAPGRVEPKTGEIRIAAGFMGRISHVLVNMNDRVTAGEVLLRLDDREARARLAAAEAEAAARQKQRNAQGKSSGRSEINDAEDAVYAAERALTGARFGLDEALVARRRATGTNLQVDDAENRLKRAMRQLQKKRIALAVAQSKADVSLPTLLESALSRARAEVSAADAVLAKTRIRASVSGMVLRINAKVGEMVAPGPRHTLVMIGDTSSLRVKAEVDEGDIAKIKIDQKVFIRSPSHPGKKFVGIVSVIAPSLAPPRIGPRGPRRANDVEVLEVTINLRRDVPLLPGLKVDAFFEKSKD